MNDESRLANSGITIVGLGLMGGSLARAIRPYVANITAVDPNQKSLNAALQEGVIDRGTADLAQGISGAGIIILAIPVRTILDILEKLPSLCPQGCSVLDLGSTKGAVCRSMDKLRAPFQAIGGHPMCGKESSGFDQADADLFHNKTFVLCRTKRTTAEMEQTALKIVEVIGGRPLFLEPARHDELVSLTSHLPYLVSAVLMRQAAETAGEQENLWQVSASGFRDSSRLSGSSPAVMGDILLTNRAAVLNQLRRCRNLFEELIDLMESKSDRELIAWLEKAQQDHQAYKRDKDSRNP